MRHLQCRVSDEVYEQVAATGSVQRFLGEAIKEKLEDEVDQMDKILESIDRRLSLLEPPKELTVEQV